MKTNSLRSSLHLSPLGGKLWTRLQGDERQHGKNEVSNSKRILGEKQQDKREAARPTTTRQGDERQERQDEQKRDRATSDKSDAENKCLGEALWRFAGYDSREADARRLGHRHIFEGNVQIPAGKGTF